MSSENTELPQWLSRLVVAYSINNVVSLRPELSFFLIRWDGRKKLQWMNLSDPNQRLRPFHFEIYYGKESLRDSYYLKMLKEAAEKDNVVVGNLFGFWDMFCPLPADSEHRTFLYMGQFLCDPPEWESLSDSWRTLTGQEPASANPDFVHFVRMIIKLPVLEPQLLDAVKEFVLLHATFLSEKSAGKERELQKRIDDLNREVISKLWPIADWVDSVISSDKFSVPPWHFEGKITDWIREGMGISRLPTTAMALMPLDSRTESLDPVQTLVRNARIQRECIRFARELDETVATRLQDYGISIITSCGNGENTTHARLELRELAQSFRGFVNKRFHVRTVVGIGRTLPAGSALHESHADAVHALHMCVQLQKDVLFFDGHGSPVEQFRYADLQKAADKLVDALNRESSTELKLASDRYVQLVLRYSNERIESARGQFLAILFQLFYTVQRRNPMRTDARDSFVSGLANSLEEAGSLNQVIEAFNEALQRLSLVSSKVWHGPSVMLFESTLQYLHENFSEPLPLPEVAKKGGFSVPVFTRVFKQSTGTSFLAYLRTIRVEHAKKLLSTTAMTIEQIAQACGFHSQHHLIRSFKKVTAHTPGSFRKSHSNREPLND